MAKQSKPKPVWAILNRERVIELYVGTEPPYLDPAGFISANRGTKFFGQLVGTDTKAAIGFELMKVGNAVEVSISVALKRATKAKSEGALVFAP
jgi:hypothetical protein